MIFKKISSETTISTHNIASDKGTTTKEDVMRFLKDKELLIDKESEDSLMKKENKVAKKKEV